MLIRFLYFIVILVSGIEMFCQEQKPQQTKEKFDRKEEILYDNKRYRKYNNYVTIGAGFIGSDIRNDVQKVIGFDYQFHIRKQQFQSGILMSGNEFLSNNHIQGHIGYGIRKEKNTSNFALYGGISYATGVIAIYDSTQGYVPKYYDGFGVYFSAQAITKFTYDIGLGVDVFGEYSENQKLFGLKFVMFFSGAYRGEKKNFNPNVRSENKK